MKKYLAAAVVALMVFAFSAFAASLNVNAGTLQAGVDGDLQCAENADVTFRTGPNPVDVTEHNFRVVGIDVTFDTEDCDGELATIRVNNDGLDDWAAGYAGDNFAIAAIQGNSVSFDIDDDSLESGYVAVEALEIVSLMVKSPSPGEFDGYSSGIFGMNLTP